jgi:hypothetical protein
MQIKLTYDRVALFGLVLVCALITVAVLSAGTATVATVKVLDAKWQEYHEATITEHRAELGRAEVERIKSTWIMYYNTCLFMTNGQMDTCLQSTRNGYINGVHDEKPLPGWDWDFIQYGKFLEEG